MEHVLAQSTYDFVSNISTEGHKDDTDESLFYFETDDLALKGNSDYLKLMKTLAVLETQRMKVCKDIDDLENLKLKAAEEPETVLQDAMGGKLNCLNRIKIAEVPDIDWSKYRSLNSDDRGQLTTRKMNRPDMVVKKEVEISPNDSQIRVRGRVYNEKKPRNFNQLWTLEEQLRLEELLREFPPEPVENRRWKKIADALGNRTTQQVCSRVQKYLRKLQNAGISVPGLSTKPTTSKKHATSVHKRHKHLLYKPTTFFPGVAMGELEGSDSDEAHSHSHGGGESSTDLSHWSLILKRINEERTSDQPKVDHIGYKCCHCSKEPIRGVRWECSSCTHRQLSYCSDCMTNFRNMNPAPHPLVHQFRPCDIFIHPAYNMEAFHSDSYLDPNFIK